MSGTLYIVGTPIGNLGDLSPRAVETLQTADFIAAEDTRVTLKLLNHFAIKKPLVSYFEHNRREKGELIADRLLAGESMEEALNALKAEGVKRNELYRAKLEIRKLTDRLAEAEE